MVVLTQFLYRLCFGLALGMALTSPRLVTSGYFRVHLYVALGLNTLAAMVALVGSDFAAWPGVAGAVTAYVGSVCWLYEKPRAGRVALLLVAALALFAAWNALAVPDHMTGLALWIHRLDPIGGGLVLGLTMAAMFLGHWYLNTPTMQLEPLRRLVRLMVAALALRVLLALIALGIVLAGAETLSGMSWLLLSQRWLWGLLGALVLCWMTWQTLKVPNTQSATGILYVAVIATFVGELVSQLLSVETGYPL